MHLHKRIQRTLLALATTVVVSSAGAATPFANVGPILAAVGSTTSAQAPALKPIAVRANAVAVSRPVSQIALEQPHLDFDPMVQGRAPKNPFLRKAPLKTELPYGDRDGAISGGGLAPAVMPPTIVSFEGMNNTANGVLFGSTVSPPDTNGDIGRTHYVQTVNLAVQIFNINGTPLTAPFKMSSLFAALGTGNICATDNDGDPIVLYDHLADRWMISQFALTPPFHQCIAVSQSGDPTGAYYVYDFIMPGNNANDYPHFGVWPDAYYMTDNQFNASLTAFTGAGVFAYDRNKMLVGDPSATYIYFDQPAALGIGGQLPSDLDGPPPPAGTGNIFAMFTANEFGDPGGDGIRLWEFEPDFDTPANSTYTEITTEAAPIPVLPFDPSSPTGRGDVGQPGTTARLDTISDRLMYRLQYRNFGTHESLVVNNTVNVGTGVTIATYRAGVRYYELRRVGGPGNPWTIHEQATHAPADTVNRWMASAALDRAGNLAVGYSASDAISVFPSIRIAGRLVGDPPGGLAQGEGTIIAGSRSQTDANSRWGDYSMMGVDPVDDCTFWYTTEYYSTPAPPTCGAAPQCWQTRVASFRYPSCASAPLPGSISGVVTNSVTGLPVLGVAVTAGNGYAGTTDGNGNYSIFIPAGTYAMATAKTGYTDGTASGVVVPVSGRVTRNFQIGGFPILALNSQSNDDSGVGGNDNGTIDFDECSIITTFARNSGGGSATNTQGVLSTTTPGVTITAANSSFGTILPGSLNSNATPFAIQTSPSFAAGIPLNFSLALAAPEGNWVETFSLPSGTRANVPVAFPASGPVSIPDNNPTGNFLNIPVAGLTTPVSKVTVSVRLTQSWIGDFVIRLASPDNTVVLLASQIGGPNNNADNLGTDCPADTNDFIFDDAAAASVGSLPAGTNNRSGTFRPTEPLAGFNGKFNAQANGNWQLRVVDVAAGDVGTIACVTLNIDGFVSTAGPCGSPPTDALFSNGFEEPVR